MILMDIEQMDSSIEALRWKEHSAGYLTQATELRELCVKCRNNASNAPVSTKAGKGALIGGAIGGILFEFWGSAIGAAIGALIGAFDNRSERDDWQDRLAKLDRLIFTEQEYERAKIMEEKVSLRRAEEAVAQGTATKKQEEIVAAATLESAREAVTLGMATQEQKDKVAAASLVAAKWAIACENATEEQREEVAAARKADKAATLEQAKKAVTNGNATRKQLAIVEEEAREEWNVSVERVLPEVESQVLALAQQKIETHNLLTNSRKCSSMEVAYTAQQYANDLLINVRVMINNGEMKAAIENALAAAAVAQVIPLYVSYGSPLRDDAKIIASQAWREVSTAFEAARR
jgi:hypothetical protein